MQVSRGLEALLRRDRVIVLAALGALVLLAWAYLIWFGGAPMDMAGSPAPMAGMDAGMDRAPPDEAVLRPSLAPWSAADFLLMLLMWVAMMIGMMTPSVAPMILIYALVARSAEAGGRPFATSSWFTAGYLLAWSGFALIATTLQWTLESAALLTPMMATASPVLGGALLIAAGLYQWTPLKQACLAQCQSPFQFIQRHGGFRGDLAGSVSLGMRHGLYCISCCWALMLLLFVVGVMNLLWIAALAALVLAEKLIPTDWLFPRLSGIILMGAGVALLV